MERNLRKERIGVVVSNKMEKTIVVAASDLRQVREQDDEVRRRVTRRDLQGRRHRPYHGDPPAEQNEALEISTNY